VDPAPPLAAGRPREPRRVRAGAHDAALLGPQLGIGYSVIALSSLWLLIPVTLLATDQWVWFPFWLGVGSLFVVDRVVSAWSGGSKARLLAVLLIPELLYDMYLDIVYVKGIFDITFARNARWGHVAHATQPAPQNNEIETRATAEATA
jgi:hypothetical protein